MRDVALSLILVVIAVVVSRTWKLRLESELLVAVVRAIAQLAAVAAVIDLVFEDLGWSFLLLAVMAIAGSLTSARRLAGVPRAGWVSLASIALGTCVALVILFSTGVFPFEPQWVVPITGMLVGNSMIATSLAGARVRDELSEKSLEIEARLALGVPVSHAVAPYLRRASATALIPTIDSTKNVGLIFLPGAFVGMILGGSTPAEAAEVQLVVLFMLLGAISVAAIVSAQLVASAFKLPGERIAFPARAEGT